MTTERLFFALWPGDPLQARLDAVARDLLAGVGRRVAAANLHLTLAFLGPVPLTQRACVEAAADRVHGRPFTLRLDRPGWFAGPRVAWIGAAAVPAALSELVAGLQAELATCGFQPEHRPFQVHVTLARKVRAWSPPAAAPEPLDWAVGEFCLLRSETLPAGVRYTLLRRWRLAGVRDLAEE